MVLRKCDYFLFSIFLYSTSIVDLYRQANKVIFHLSDSFVDIFRNVIYIGLFFLIVGRMIFLKRGFLFKYTTSTLVFFFVLLCSLALEYRLSNLYPDFILMYFSRLSIAFIIGYYVTDWNSFLNIYLKFIWIPLFYSMFVLFFPESFIGASYMTVAYNILPHCVCCFAYALMIRERRYFLYFLILFSILFLGARGALFGCLLTIVFAMILDENSKGKTMVRYGIYSLFLVIVIEGISSDNVIDFLSTYNLNARTMMLFFSDEGIFNMTNRDSFYLQGLESLSNFPLLIRGYGGNIVFYKDLFGGDEGTYAHNIFLELFLDYGLIIGGILVLWFIYYVMRSFFIVLKSNQYVKIAYLSFFVCWLIPMLVSSSYTSGYHIWLSCGIIVNMVHNKSIYFK